jgi:hypothetical protein
MVTELLGTTKPWLINKLSWTRRISEGLAYQIGKPPPRDAPGKRTKANRARCATPTMGVRVLFYGAATLLTRPLKSALGEED